MKSYTDIKQSKKLAEILPIESADMHYGNFSHNGLGYENKFSAGLTSYTKEIKFYEKLKEYYGIKKYNGIVAWEVIPCWSLAALLGVLPFHLIVNNQRYIFSMHKGLNKDGETYIFRYNVFNTNICLYSTDYYNSPIDACVDMIKKLHELKMLFL